MIPPPHPVCFVSRNCWMHGAQFYSAIFSQSLACFSDFPVPVTTPMHLHGLLEDCVEEVLRSFCLGGHMLPHTWAIGESLSGAVVPGLMSSAGQPLEVSSHIHSYNELTQKKVCRKEHLANHNVSTDSSGLPEHLGVLRVAQTHSPPSLCKACIPKSSYLTTAQQQRCGHCLCAENRATI